MGVAFAIDIWLGSGLVLSLVLVFVHNIIWEFCLCFAIGTPLL